MVVIIISACHSKVFLVDSHAVDSVNLQCDKHLISFDHLTCAHKVLVHMYSKPEQHLLLVIQLSIIYCQLSNLYYIYV